VPYQPPAAHWEHILALLLGRDCTRAQRPAMRVASMAQTTLFAAPQLCTCTPSVPRGRPLGFLPQRLLPNSATPSSAVHRGLGAPCASGCGCALTWSPAA